MFPDLTSDDVFRFESKRLWLRWPRAMDAAAIAEFASRPDVAPMSADIPHPYPPQEAERFIIKARAENAAGRALHLVVTHKAGASQPVVGIVSARVANAQDVEIGYAMAPEVWGRGMATEALRATVDMVFSVTAAMRILAKSRVVNIASRRVLEKNGFVRLATAVDPQPELGDPHPSDHFLLDRTMWHRNILLRRMPPMAQQHRDGAEANIEAVEIRADSPAALPQY